MYSVVRKEYHPHGDLKTSVELCVICGESPIALGGRKRRVTADVTSFSLHCKDTALKMRCQEAGERNLKHFS